MARMGDNLSIDFSQGCLLHVRAMCEAASSSLTGHGITPETAICLYDLDSRSTLTLKDFILAQQTQGDKALKQLKVFLNCIMIKFIQQLYVYFTSITFVRVCVQSVYFVV